MTALLYAFVLFSVITMTVGIDAHVHFLDHPPLNINDAPLNAIILSLFIVYFVSSGVRKWFLLFAGVPLFIGMGFLYFSDIMHNEIVPHSLVVITFIVLTVISRMQERFVRNEYRARALADTKMQEVEKEKEKFEQLFRYAPDAIFLQTLDGHIMDCNRKAEEITGFTRSDLLEMSVYDLVPEKDRVLIPKEVEQLQIKGDSFTTGTNIRKNGEPFPIEVSSRLLARGGSPYALVVVRDISTQVKAAEEIKKLSAAVEHSSASIIITSIDGTILYTNPKFSEITGYTREDVYGKNPRILRSEAHEEEFYKNLWDTILSGKEWRGEFQNLTKAGTPYWESASIAPILNDREEVEYFVAVKEDITEKKQREDEIHHLAMYDPLTALVNRTLFFDSVKKSIARADRNKESLALLYIDLDKFKPINDIYGHEVGDAVLKEVGRKLLGTVREMDVAARLGGDEFALLLQGYLTREDIQMIARRVQENIEKPIVLPPGGVEVGASIGICLFPHDANEIETLLSRADEAMYRVKKEGRGGIKFYSEIG